MERTAKGAPMSQGLSGVAAPYLDHADHGCRWRPAVLMIIGDLI